MKMTSDQTRKPVLHLSLLVLVPLSLATRYFAASPFWIFVARAGAVAVLAEWMRRATEQVAKHAGPAIGGLLMVSFGSIAELLLALFVLASGEAAVVQAQIAGSSLAPVFSAWAWPFWSAALRDSGRDSIRARPACFRRF
jgi:calcium/proton exchanger cax